MRNAGGGQDVSLSKALVCQRSDMNLIYTGNNSGKGFILTIIFGFLLIFLPSVSNAAIVYRYWKLAYYAKRTNYGTVW